MLIRKIFDYLREWKASRKKECLLINGARQVGKSFVVDAFGRECYESFISIDFARQPQLKEVFAGELDAQSIYSRLTLYLPGIRIVPENTLLFLDELQECPRARTAFKFLAQDGRCDVIGSGSLLGIRFRQMEDAPFLPVGYERQITMRPLDFEEFLWALGYSEDDVAQLRSYFEGLEPVPAGINSLMMRYLREYLAIGGMPAVVQSFLDAKSYGAVHDAQSQLHALYLDDVAKYAPPGERVKARACYLSLPRQLAKGNTRFSYATVESRGRARKFEGSVDWLVGAEMALRCTAVSTAQFPLSAYEEEGRFRLYAADTGLLMAMYDFSMKAAVIDNTLKGPMKGGLYENLVACMLASLDVPLRFWRSNDSKHEIEFLVDRAGRIVPIEVKAGRGSTVSLNTMLERDDVALGYKLVDGNVGRDGKKVTLPLWMAMFLLP